MLNAFFKTFFLTLIPFVGLDALWLGLIAPRFYRSQIGFLLADRPNWAAAIDFYIVFIAGLVIFVTGNEDGVLSAALRGALFGFICYATYDLTNLATIRDWPVILTLVDMSWGTVLGGMTSALAVWLKGVF